MTGSRSPAGGPTPSGRPASASGPAPPPSQKGSVLPPAEIRSYYDRPVLQEPAWTWQVPWYFFFGGLAGASAVLAAAARKAGNEPVARTGRRAALGGAVVSPPLLIADLGRPERFHHMLRVFRPTSPLSVGSWILAGFGPAAGASGVLAEVGRLPRLQRIAEGVAAALGPAMATYTAALVSATAVPVWHEARYELPVVFAGSAAASAAAAAVMTTSTSDAAAPRRVAVAGALLELVATAVMDRRLGELAEPYHEGDAGRWARAARALTSAGVAVTGTAGRRRGGALLGGALLLGGSLAQRWAVYRAGFQSARDPKYTVGPQRRRLEDRPIG